MTELLEIRDKLKRLYGRNEIFITPLIKFLVAFLVFNTMNAKIGYMTGIDNVAVVLILALMCSFLPNGAMVFIAALLSLAHMYALALEVALVGLCAYLILFLLFIRLNTKDSILILITPLLFLYKIPYVIPIVLGLIGTPVAAISAGCGVFVYFFFVTIVSNAAKLNTMVDEDILLKVRLLIDGIMENREMVVIIVAFTITISVVYLLRRMSTDYSWTIAIIAGVIIDLLILLVGDLLYDTNMPVFNAVIGSLIAVVVAKIIEFFGFFVDYSRTERVQFEDDEYYYYVKAVPKISVSAPAKTVKRINTQHSSQGRGKTVERTEAAVSRRSRNVQVREEPEGSDDEFEELF